MSDKIIQKFDDDDLVYFFKNFNTILDSPKIHDIDRISTAVDFTVFSDFFIKDIKILEKELDTAKEDELLSICEHVFNILDWLSLIDSGPVVFREAWQRVFEQNFGDKDILNTLYDESLERWIKDRNGQYKLGLNTYSVIDGALHYRDYFKGWFEVDRKTAFDMQPQKTKINSKDLVEELEKDYKETNYDLVIKDWESQGYKGSLSDSFLDFEKETTTPEEYFDFTFSNIKTLNNSPVSIDELERWNGGRIDHLEDIVKLYVRTFEIVEKIRHDDSSHVVYLLRDCLSFYEMHKLLDLLDSRDTSSDQVAIGRKLLSHKPDKWGFYIVFLEALYEAHRRYPDNFDEFYKEFSRLLDILVEVSLDFSEMLEKVKEYIAKHIVTNKSRILVFDVGFQGSINLFIKYVIDKHINPYLGEKDRREVEIKVSVGALWSKEMFGKRAMSFYFPFLNRIQYMARSDELYNYKFGSLKDGRIDVIMGGKDSQKKAAIELVVLVMVTKLLYKQS